MPRRESRPEPGHCFLMALASEGRQPHEASKKGASPPLSTRHFHLVGALGLALVINRRSRIPRPQPRKLGRRAFPRRAHAKSRTRHPRPPAPGGGGVHRCNGGAEPPGPRTQGWSLRFSPPQASGCGVVRAFPPSLHMRRRPLPRRICLALTVLGVAVDDGTCALLTVLPRRRVSIDTGGMGLCDTHCSDVILECSFLFIETI